MTRRDTTDVTCPFCKTTLSVTYYKSLNKQISPEAANALLDGSLFKLTCPACGKMLSLNYSMLYHDMEQRVMVQYAVDKDAEKDSLDTLDKIRTGTIGVPGADMSGYRFRIVSSQNELHEKAVAFDNGVDDRVLELCKYMAPAALQDERCPIGTKACLSDVTPEGKYEVEFLVLDDVLTVTIPADFVRKVASIYDLDDVNPPDYRIDQNWAMGVFEEEGRS